MNYYTAAGAVLSLVGGIGLTYTLLNLSNSPPAAAPHVLVIFLFLVCASGMVSNKKFDLLTASTLLTGNWMALQLTAAPLVNYINQMPEMSIMPAHKTMILMVIGAEIIATTGLLFMVRMSIKNRQEMKAIQTSQGGLLNKLSAVFKKINQKENTDNLDTVLCYDTQTNEPVILKGTSRFVSTAIFGTTGSGKTKSILNPLIYQDLIRVANGQKMAITVIEPTKDLTDDVALMCEKLNIPYIYIDPTNPNTHKFNILQGDKMIAAEATRSVLASLFGQQQAFFSQIQQTAARNTVLLLKELHGDNIDMLDVLRTLRDASKLQGVVNQLKRKQGTTDLVQFFEFELLGAMKDKYHQFAAGLRQQLEDIAGNPLLKRVLLGQSDVDLDKHLSEGGVLLVNTAMGDLSKKLSEVFGEYVLMHLISAVYRKPKQYWIVPHALFIDELPKYLNPDIGFDDLLAIGRKYGNITTVAMQSTSQLTLKLGKKEHTQSTLNLCRNKVVFGGMDATDARLFSEEFGEKEVEIKQSTYENKVIVPSMWAKSYRTTKSIEARYDYTRLMELTGYQFIYRVVENGSLQPPGEGKGKLVNIEGIKPPGKSDNIKNIVLKFKSWRKQAKKQPLESQPVNHTDSNKPSIRDTEINEPEPVMNEPKTTEAQPPPVKIKFIPSQSKPEKVREKVTPQLSLGEKGDSTVPKKELKPEEIPINNSLDDNFWS